MTKITQTISEEAKRLEKGSKKAKFMSSPQ
jgi:hypothetical protein